MKASSLKKESEVIENIYQIIINANGSGCYKTFITHDRYVSDEVRLQLIKDGYKVYVGDWDGITTNALIIEW